MRVSHRKYCCNPIDSRDRESQRRRRRTRTTTTTTRWTKEQEEKEEEEEERRKAKMIRSMKGVEIASKIEVLIDWETWVWFTIR